MGDFADVDGIVDVLKMKEEIKQLKQQLSLTGCEFAEYEKTKKELKEAVEVIEFYGNIRNWEADQIDSVDHEEILDRWDDLEWLGGKRARQFLLKYR